MEIWRAGLAIARGSPWFGVGRDGALLFVGVLLSTLSRAGWVRLAPLLLAVALLNTWDLTLFEPEVLVPASLAVAYWSGRSGTPVGTPRAG